MPYEPCYEVRTNRDGKMESKLFKKYPHPDGYNAAEDYAIEQVEAGATNSAIWEWYIAGAGMGCEQALVIYPDGIAGSSLPIDQN